MEVSAILYEEKDCRQLVLLAVNSTLLTNLG